MTDTQDMHALSVAAQTGQPEAQYRLGALYFSKGEINAALDWLNQAAGNNLADAQNLLGIIYLNGIGTQCQPQKAAELFGMAADLDLKEAHFNLAGLLFSGSAIQNDDVSALRHLSRAVELHHSPALRVLGYLYGSTGDAAHQELATRCFAQAALSGDAHSEYALAMRYLNGTGMGINLDEGAYWMIHAANKQLYCARSRLKLLMTEIGEARLQRVMQQHVSIAKQFVTGPFELRDSDTILRAEISPKPDPGAVLERPGFLGGQLCDYLVNLAAPRVLPSGVVDPNTGRPLKTALRTSSSMNFQLSMYDMAVGLICRRLAALAGTAANHAEPVSVLRYLPGEEYKPHYDHFAVNEQGIPKVQDMNGQRIVTVFVYLNDVDAGGETDFPRLGVRVHPGKGKAVAFLNCDAVGKPNPDTLHAGLPVIRGEKWLATLWFRERSFNWM